MALSIKQLNGDASFLLAFEPITADDTATSTFQEPFHILLDPWLIGPSHEYHPRLLTTTHWQPTLIPPLHHLPIPDVVVISQDKSDHCNEATLRQLPRTGAKTVILAEASAARTIRSWGHFDADKVLTLPRWEDPRKTGRDSSTRIEVPPQTPGGEPGEVTVSFIPQHRDLRNQHPTIGITYRPPSSRPSEFPRPGQTPPATPKSPLATFPPQLPPPRPSTGEPSSATVRSTPSLPTPPASPSLRPKRSIASLTPHLRDRVVSVLFSPHGASYGCVEPYATSHLVAEAALPLTALLHCFDDVDDPWWCGGASRSRGMCAGSETASALGAKAWVSTHDGEKQTTGLMGSGVRRRRYGLEEVRARVVRAYGGGGSTGKKAKRPTEVLALGIGDTVAMTSEGIWEADS